MDLGKPWKGAQKWNHSGVPPLLAQKMTQKSLCKCFASVQFTWMHKLSASKVYVRANSPCLSPLCPKVYLSERKWFVFCSCKSRFLQINVDPGFRFSVSGVTFVSRSVSNSSHGLNTCCIRGSNFLVGMDGTLGVAPRHAYGTRSASFSGQTSGSVLMFSPTHLRDSFQLTCWWLNKFRDHLCTGGGMERTWKYS